MYREILIFELNVMYLIEGKLNVVKNEGILFIVFEVLMISTGMKIIINRIFPQNNVMIVFLCKLQLEIS